MQDMENEHARERRGERMGRTTCRHTHDHALKHQRFSHVLYASACMIFPFGRYVIAIALVHAHVCVCCVEGVDSIVRVWYV